MRLPQIIIFGASAVLGGLGGFLGWNFMVFISLSIVIILVETIRPKWNNKPWDYLSWFTIGYFVLYVFVPFNLGFQNEYIYKRVQSSNSEILSAHIMILFAYLLTVFGYYFSRRTSKPDPITFKKIQFESMFIGIGFVAVGVLCFYVYAQIYGGFHSLFKNSDMIRAGLVGGSGLVFVRKLMPFVVFGAWLIIANFYFSKLSRIQKLIYTIVLLSLSLIVIFSTAGRLEVLLIFIPLILGPYFFQNRPPGMGALSLFGGCVIAWVLFGDPIFTWISYGTWIKTDLGWKSYFAVINQLSHPFESYLAAVQNVPVNFGIRGLSDIFGAIFSLLPQKLLAMDFEEPISALNTYLLTGIWKSIIPPGMLGFFFHMFSYPGVLVGCFLFGLLMRRIEEFFVYRSESSVFITYLHIAFAVSIIHYLMAGDPEVYLQNYFWLIIGTIFIIIFAKNKRINLAPENDDAFVPEPNQ